MRVVIYQLFTEVSGTRIQVSCLVRAQVFSFWLFATLCRDWWRLHGLCYRRYPLLRPLCPWIRGCGYETIRSHPFFCGNRAAAWEPGRGGWLHSPVSLCGYEFMVTRCCIDSLFLARLLCQGTDTVEVAKMKWGLGGVVEFQCNCWLIAANLYWMIVVYRRLTHQCVHSCSETYLSSNCWLQPTCTEGLLCTWDIATNVLICALRQFCPGSPRPPQKPDALLCPLDAETSYLKLPSLPLSVLTSSWLNFKFLGDESPWLSLTRYWLQGGRGAQSPGSGVGRWWQVLFLWSGDLASLNQYSCRNALQVEFELCCFKRLYFEINLQKSCQNTQNSYIL